MGFYVSPVDEVFLVPVLGGVSSWGHHALSPSLIQSFPSSTWYWVSRADLLLSSQRRSRRDKPKTRGVVSLPPARDVKRDQARYIQPNQRKA